MDYIFACGVHFVSFIPGIFDELTTLKFRIDGMAGILGVGGKNPNEQ